MQSGLLKKNWSTIKIPMFLITLVFCLCSCQTLVFAYYGIKNPNKAISKEKRFAYYEPFTSNPKIDVKLYALSDTTKWTNIFQKLEGYSFPMIYLRNNRTDSLYSISCYEDIKWEINLINDDNLQYTYSGDEEKMAHIKKIITDKAEPLYDSKKQSLTSAKWDIHIVSATFLGKKLRKRMLPIFTLKGLGAITILDISRIEK